MATARFRPSTVQAYMAAECCLFAGAVGGAALTSRQSDWHPISLVAILLPLSVAGTQLTVRIREQHLNSSFVALVLAAVLLGPGPAVAAGTLVATVVALTKHQTRRQYLVNLAIFSVFPLAGGLLARLTLNHVNGTPASGATPAMTFGLVVFGIFIVTNILNFVLVALHFWVLERNPLKKQFRYLFIPMLPGQVATGALAAMLAVAFRYFGYPALIALVLVLGIFQYLAAALLRSEERADQLEARSIRLASLQLGVLVTLVETLALRDRAAARHAAAVARYSRALAVENHCTEAEQDIVHSAGLLHDIGKFALPDRILNGTSLSEEDRSVIRRHPQEGATLVGRLDGYGPVADVILYHHENMNGTGYPAGLIGNEIPLLSRILAVANAYDSLTARDSRRSPMTPMDAMVELRRMAGHQIDGALVECFITMLERNGPVTHAEGDDADFEAELAFERRARTIAQPALV
jgi:putative nucleotidyltransferase with HDIG domain